MSPVGDSSRIVEPGLVSIVTPAYKADRFLPDTLAGVLTQTYPQWEYLLCEDASTGDTPRLIAGMAASRPGNRVEYIRHKVNRGPAATRNTALQFVQGEYVAFLDADDVWQPTHLEASIAALRAYGADVAYSTVTLFADDTGKRFGKWGPTPREVKEFPEGLFARNFITPSASVIRRCVLDSLKGFDVDPQIQMCDDLDFWLRAVEKRFRFVHLAGEHVLYRKGHAGAGTSNMARMTRTQLYALEKHRGMTAISPAAKEAGFARVAMTAGAAHFLAGEEGAASYLMQGWKRRPERVHYLAGAAVAAALGPLVGWWKKSAKPRGQKP